MQVDSPNPIDVDALKTLYSSRGAVNRASVDPALVALNTMMVHGFGMMYPANRTSFFIDDPARVGLPTAHRRFDVGGGIELWRGFFTSVRPTINALFLNVDTTTGRPYPNWADR